uniref:Uncharacterized protein n=1 Tax=Rhizophora mucronata TaxID=61149 RepID=A0A2P2J7T7_RHIMU
MTVLRLQKLAKPRFHEHYSAKHDQAEGTLCWSRTVHWESILAIFSGKHGQEAQALPHFPHPQRTCTFGIPSYTDEVHYYEDQEQKAALKLSRHICPRSSQVPKLEREHVALLIP